MLVITQAPYCSCSCIHILMCNQASDAEHEFDGSAGTDQLGLELRGPPSTPLSRAWTFLNSKEGCLWSTSFTSSGPCKPKKLSRHSWPSPQQQTIWRSRDGRMGAVLVAEYQEDPKKSQDFSHPSHDFLFWVRCGSTITMPSNKIQVPQDQALRLSKTPLPTKA